MEDRTDTEKAIVKCLRCVLIEPNAKHSEQGKSGDLRPRGRGVGGLVARWQGKVAYLSVLFGIWAKKLHEQ